MRIGLIGCGAIGQLLYRLVSEQVEGVHIVAVVERVELHSQVRNVIGHEVQLVDSVHALLPLKLDLVVECAGHAALKGAAPILLEAGVDVLVASVGAIADPQVEAALREAALRGGAQVRIPSGALGGLDVLSAARSVGLDEVIYSSNKAPAAWRGTAAENMVSLATITEPTVFFTGTARFAARLFPQNANVAAAVALSGVGFERTQVTLVANPLATGNTHRILAKGAFGEIDVTVRGKPLESNPKTSMLAPYSLVHCLTNLSSCLSIG